MCCAVLCYFVLCYFGALLYYNVVYFVLFFVNCALMLFYVVLCCVVLYCVVLCCIVLYCVVLCCSLLKNPATQKLCCLYFVLFCFMLCYVMLLLHFLLRELLDISTWSLKALNWLSQLWWRTLSWVTGCKVQLPRDEVLLEEAEELCFIPQGTYSSSRKCPSFLQTWWV